MGWPLTSDIWDDVYGTGGLSKVYCQLKKANFTLDDASFIGIELEVTDL
jgi:hypothetical protein